MALEVGAGMRSMTYSGALSTMPSLATVDGHGKDDLMYLSMSALSPGVVVNKFGQRFCDETLGSRVYGNIMLKSLSVTGYFIIDSATYALGATQLLVKEITANGGLIYQANDIPTLATTAGINPYLATELTNYNAAIDAGTVKNLLVPRTGTATKIATSPFYAIPFVISSISTYGGIQINPQGNVEDVDGFAIPGLYAAGAVMQGSLTGGGVELSGGNYLGLLACCLVWGVVDAENAAAYAKTIT